ncbi:MAG: hypothetical protein SH820_07060 [Xanthomonadales bacterium]|nr:hypothetical protein [Xanthomonadales bacterium]
MMNRRGFTKNLLAMGSVLAAPSAVRAGTSQKDSPKLPPNLDAYQAGDSISPEVFVTDRNLSNHSLLSILKNNSPNEVNVLFIFGGGAMGHNSPGGIWCPDSFEDLHMLRTLKDAYQNTQVGFVFVACAPVFHSKYLGFSDRLFLDQPDDSIEFINAVKLFIHTTQAALENGIIPQQPYYDLRLRLMMDRSPGKTPTAGTIYDWQGKFRDPDENQKYGVPNIWLLDKQGTALTAPFRGNMYHPKPGDSFQISYTISDVDQAIRQQLARAR